MNLVKISLTEKKEIPKSHIILTTFLGFWTVAWVLPNDLSDKKDIFFLKFWHKELQIKGFPSSIGMKKDQLWPNIVLKVPLSTQHN